MSDVDELLCKVEMLRSQLHCLIKHKPFCDPDVLGMSQQLDQALNKYAAVKEGQNNSRKKQDLVD